MKRVVRILISLLGAGAFIGIRALICQSLDALGIVNVEERLTSTALAAIYGTVGLCGLLITFMCEPAIARAMVRNLKAIENKINQVPMQDVLSGIAGLMVGLILALLLSTFIGRIPVAWISVPLSLIVYIVMGYLGMTVAIKRKGELPLFVRRPQRAGRRRDARASAATAAPIAASATFRPRSSTPRSSSTGASTTSPRPACWRAG